MGKLLEQEQIRRCIQPLNHKVSVGVGVNLDQLLDHVQAQAEQVADLTKRLNGSRDALATAILTRNIAREQVRKLRECVSAYLDYNQLIPSAFFAKYPEAEQHRRDYGGLEKPTEVWLEQKIAHVLRETAQAEAQNEA